LFCIAVVIDALPASATRGSVDVFAARVKRSLVGSAKGCANAAFFADFDAAARQRMQPGGDERPFDPALAYYAAFAPPNPTTIMPSTEPRGPKQILKALRWSWQGLKAGFAFEASFRLEVYLFVIFAPLGLWLGAGPIEKSILVGSLILVLAAELLNSAVEAIVDKASPEFHVLAGRAKDMGSAAVFLLMINVMLCWGLILGSRWIP
jgi:diacylglycerol kinase (ATP)